MGPTLQKKKILVDWIFQLLTFVADGTTVDWIGSEQKSDFATSGLKTGPILGHT
jgi:hypothetical protein